MKKEITTRTDIEFLVNAFYTKAKKDEIIGHFFTEVVNISWETHIPKIVNFWEAVLLDNPVYRGNPMTAHIELDQKSKLNPEHFEQWKKLFGETLDEHFVGENVDKAKTRADIMGNLMMYKIERSRADFFIQ